MKIVVFSDSHGDYQRLLSLVERHIDDADIFMHLGDGQSEFLKIAGMFPHKKMLSVPGNCDWGSRSKPAEMLHAAGKKILYTHGHIYRVKDHLTMLREAALANDAKIALFGHTHIAMSSFDGRVHLFNPGSITKSSGGIKPSYGIIELTRESINPRIVTL